MSSLEERRAEDQYEAQNDDHPDVPGGVTDNSYIPSDTSLESKEVPIVKDDVGAKELDETSFPANSDAQLGTFFLDFDIQFPP